MTTSAAWLVALSHLTAALHFVLVSHEICQAHGELVHGVSHEARQPAAARGANLPAARGTAALPAGEDAGDEHCPLWARRLEQAAVFDAPSVRVASLEDAPATVAKASAAIAPSRDRILLAAPKQSPPS